MVRVALTYEGRVVAVAPIFPAALDPLVADAARRAASSFDRRIAAVAPIARLTVPIRRLVVVL